MGNGLQRVIDRFPQLAASIRDCFDGDQNFRDMCEDYAEAIEALRQCQASDRPRRQPHIEEYGDLAKALESEILAALSAPPKQPKTT